MPAGTNHPSFPQPSRPDLTIWRYLDFAKLVAMLEDSALHFARVDQMSDPFEGSLSKAEYERWQSVARAGETNPGSLPERWRGQYFDWLMLNARRARQSMYVNCWHQSEIESEAMWRLYSRSGYAIALRSTYGRLVEVLPSKIHNGCYVGMVTYADHDEDPIPEGNSFTPIMHKRKAFAHEREVRAVIWIHDQGYDTRPSLDDNPLGIDVSIEISALVERVVVSPSAPPWFGDTVARVVRRYCPSVPVEMSRLLAKPYL